MSERLKTWLCLAAVALLSLVVVWPLFGVSWFESHDMVAYPVRVMEYVRGWRHGYIYPRWGTDLYGGYGSPLFNFYPPGVHGSAAVLTLFGFNPTTALKCVVALATMLGAAGAFLCTFCDTRRRDAGLVAALVFVFMPYRLTQLYVRGNLAEYCAISLVPLSFWLYRRLVDTPGQARVLGPSAAAVHAAVAMTHTITGQWYTEIVALFVLVRLWRARRERQPLPWTSVLALACALTLAAIYLLPAFFERDWVNVAVLTEGKLETAKNLVELTWLVSVGFFFMGWPILVALPAGVVVSLTRRGNAVRWVAPWAAVTALLVVLMHHHAAPLWAYLPLGRYMMFPWRLLGFVAVFGSLMIGGLWSLAATEGRWAPFATGAMLAALFLLGRSAMPPAVDIRNVPQDEKQITEQLHSTVVFQEYLPPGASPPATPRHRFVEGTHRVEVQTSVQSGAGYLLGVQSLAVGSSLTLANFAFPGWTVKTLDGPEPVQLMTSPAKLLELRFPQPGSYRVRVSFGNTPLRTAATALTLLTLLLLALWIARPELAEKLLHVVMSRRP